MVGWLDGFGVIGQVYNTMEHAHFRKRVNLTTISSSQITAQPNLHPQWISQTQLTYLSAYQFLSYNLQQQSSLILPRQHHPYPLCLFHPKPSLNQWGCTIYHIHQQQDNNNISNTKFYLNILTPTQKQQQISIYHNDHQRCQHLAFQYIDYVMMNQKEQIERSNKSIALRTQKLIQEIKEQEQKQLEEQKNKQHSIMTKIKQVIVVLDNSFVVLVVEMQSKNGIMILNLSKCRRQDSNGDFSCPIRPASLYKSSAEPSPQQSQGPRLLYLFSDPVLSLHKTRDITQFIMLTQRHIALVKINYEQLQLNVLHKVKIDKKQNIGQIGIARIGDQEMVMALVKNQKESGSWRKGGWPGFIKMYGVEGRKLVEVKPKNGTKKKKLQIDSQMGFEDDDQLPALGTVKFSRKVLCSQYQIQQQKTQQKQCPLTGDFEGSILMSVLNKVMLHQQSSHKQVIDQKQSQRKINHQNMQSNKSIKNFPSGLFQDTLLRQNIGGMISNQDIVIIWQNQDPIVHIYRILGKKQQEDKHKDEKQDQFTKQALRKQKQRQLKQVYSQLMGIPCAQPSSKQIAFQPKITYLARVDIGLIKQNIINLVLSPNNNNLLIISTTENKQQIDCNIFQLDLFRQLGHQDPAIFVKTVKNIHKNKPVTVICPSLVKETTLFLSGKQIHSAENQLLEGALSFDLHPYGYFIAVAFGFASKVYAIQGSDKMTSLFTMNGQGMKQVKYSPLGNHLCILTSKTIKILDSYSCSSQHLLQQKISNFTKCTYSSNGLEFYTLNESHQINIYNSFDYTRIDTIRPLQNGINSQIRPISIKSFLKISQYCCVLQNGEIYVKYKPQAVVVTHQQTFHYEDNQKIVTAQIDQKNGVLFLACKSGKIRAHIWPLKQQSAFQLYSEIWTGFSSICCMALSHLSPIIFVGNEAGNISRIKYAIDREKGIKTQKQHNLLFSDRNYRYFSMQGASNIQKMYNFTLVNNVVIPTDQLSQKQRLQYKLTQVIQKLNQQMRKLKTNIRDEIQEKSKLSLQKVDFDLLHHMNQLIKTKLHKQLGEEVQINRNQIVEVKMECQKAVKEVMAEQHQLLKEKSFKIADYSDRRIELFKEFQRELKLAEKEQNVQLKVLEQKNEHAKKTSLQQEEDVFFMPNDQIHEFQQLKKALDKQLEAQHRKHYELRKGCAYKQTAIKQMNLKKIKQESLEFKIGLQKSQMQKKLGYNKNVVNELRGKIEQSEQKVQQIQAQAFIIKSNAQYKKVAKVEQMIDACSYKLWIKQKLQDQELADLETYLLAMQQIMQTKSSDVVDVAAARRNHSEQIKEVKQYLNQLRNKFNKLKLYRLSTRQKIKHIDILGQYHEIAQNKEHRRGGERRSAKVGTADVANRGSSSQSYLKRTQSSKNMAKMKQEVPIYHKLMDKETNFLRNNIKIHQRKLQKFGKQNGKLLHQFQKLQLQKKYLVQRHITATNSLQKLHHDYQQQKQQAKQKEQDLIIGKPTILLGKTSYQRYVQMKSHRSKLTPKYKTACSTPAHLATPAVMEFSQFTVEPQ